MKILVVNNMSPFVWGGAEELAVNLRRALIRDGHEAEVVRIPFQWKPATRIPSQMLMVRAMEIHGVDRVIALKFPAYLIRHPHKTIWLLHQYRQAYDLYEVGQTNLPSDSRGEAIRALITHADMEAFQETRRLLTNSIVTRDRLKRFNGFNAGVLLPPVNDPHLFEADEIGNYIFAGGRINGMKRQLLLIEAMRHASAATKLVVAGPADLPEDERLVRAAVSEHGLEDRVTLDIRFLPRGVYARYVTRSRAVAYIPYDEDSYGYVAMEGAMAKRAVITAGDSGGVVGLAQPGVTGWLAEPKPESLAEAMSAACADASQAAKRGQAAHQLWQSLDINWSRTVEALLQ